MKVKQLPFILLIAFISNNAIAQTAFQKTCGGTSYDIGLEAHQTSDGGYIMTGYTQSYGSGGQDFYVIKTDANGDTLWTKTYGDAGDDAARSIQQTSDNGYIIAGATYSYGAGDLDVLLIKTDANGNITWAKTYGGPARDAGYYVQQTTDGGYIVVGVTASFSAAFNDIYLIKTNAAGDTLWTKTYGGLGDDYATCVRQTGPDNGFIITGYTSSFTALYYDAFLIKTNSSGDMSWGKIYGGSNDDEGSDVRQTKDGGFIVTGYTYSYGAGGQDVYLIKTNPSGNLIWSKTYGGVGADVGSSVIQAKDGNFIVAGWSYTFAVGNNDVYLLKTDTSGALLWAKVYGSTDYDFGYSVEQTADSGFVIGGYTQSFGAGLYDFSLLKVDPIGNIGCNENFPNTTINNAATQVSIITNPYSSSGGTVTSPAIIPYWGTKVTTVCSDVGMEEVIPENHLSIYPNPSEGIINLFFEGNVKDGALTIFNSMGEEVYSGSFATNGSAFPVSIAKNGSKVPGIYFVQVNAGGRQYHGKLIVQ